MAKEIIISDLEQAPLLRDDMVIAVEDTKNTYSATLAQLRELVNKLFVEKEDIDFNTLTDDGFYQVGGTLTNAPVAGSITWIVQVVKVGTVIVQNALPTDATNYTRQFVRRNNGTSWGTWDVVGGKIIQSLTSSTTDVPCSKAVNDGLAKKQATITGGASTIASKNLTASRALVSDGSGKVAVSAVTSTELGYLDGVTSNLQTQLNARAKTDLSNVSAYAKFETSWFDVEKSGLYSFTLSGDILNIPLEKRRLTLLGKVKTAQNDFQVGDIIYPQNANYIGSTSQSEKGSTSWIRGNTLGIRFGNDGEFVASSPNSPYRGIWLENIQCKLIVEGWKL